MRRPLTAAALVLLCGCTGRPESSDGEVVVIRAAAMVDVDAGQIVPDPTIIVRGDRIERVATGNGAIPAGARVIRLDGMTLVPGLIDLHSHLVGDIQSASPTAPLESTAEEDLAAGRVHAQKTLAAGFTTVRDVGVYRALLDVRLRDEIASGTTPGPRMAVAGAYVTRPGGGGEVTGLPRGQVPPPEFRAGVATTPDEVRARVTWLLDGGADFIKVIATGAVLTVGTEVGAIEVPEASIRAAVEAAAARSTYVTAHAHGAEGIKAAIRAGVRSIEHGSLIDDEGIALLKERGAWLVADIYNGDYIDEVGRRDGWPRETLRKNDETATAQREGFRKAVAAGARIGYGTDSGVYPHGENARQFPYMVRYGMTPMQAIQSATIVAAQLMRWDDRVGSVAAGKYADIVAVAADPLADISTLERVRFVMKGGVVLRSEP